MQVFFHATHATGLPERVSRPRRGCVKKPASYTYEGDYESNETNIPQFTVMHGFCDWCWLWPAAKSREGRTERSRDEISSRRSLPGKASSRRAGAPA